MLKQFHESVRLYFQEAIRGINPISRTDANIMSEIIKALEKGAEKSLWELFRNYKRVPDEQLYDELIQWNSSFTRDKGPDSNKDGDSKIKYWIEIEDKVFPINAIFCIECSEMWKKGRMMYTININEVGETQKNKVLSKIIYFDTKGQRDAEYNRVKTILRTFNIEFL